ncbi:SIS domain-containing protein [Escherichia albertii]|uniref:SIS domain-containing protein n=1 Tax=Escherichia albertii TaxID=208962 RepID=UPI00223F74C7|nr:SIS domain-containing protein [Escherichia albertii]QTA13411.1 SIS domain-containing protein [Escherichia albertii]
MSNINNFSISEVASQVTDAEIRAVAAIKDLFSQQVLSDVADLLANCQGKVLVTGCGTCGAVAARTAHLLSVCGTPAFHLSPGDGLHGGLGVLTEHDVILAFSKGGSSLELNDFCARGRTLANHLVVVTANPDSALSQQADYVLNIPLEKDCDLGGVIATGCTLSFSALTDVLVELIRRMRGYEWESFFYTHPAGAVGKHAEDSLKRLHNSEQG